MKISVYNGPGVSQESLKHLKYLLRGYDLYLMAPQDVIQGRFEGGCFVMPGGRDLPYVRSLKGEGAKQIRKFVEEGGCYLGICAGSYFGGLRVEFAVGTDMEVTGERDLKFFDGVVAGPHLAPYDYRSLSGARIDKINWRKQVPVFANGGGIFVGGKAETIATYSTGEKAIIKCPVKKGRALLSAVHFEYHPDLFDLKDPYLKELYKEMDKNLLEELQASMLDILRE